MKHGVLLAPRSWGAEGDLAGLFAAAQRARALGWSVLVPEHHDRADYVPSALPLSGMLGTRFPGLDVATAGVIAGRRPAVTLCDDAVVVDRVVRSLGGRFRLGVVAGYDRGDFPDGAYAGRFALLDAAIAALARQRPLSLLVGGSGPRALTRAARVGAWLAPTRIGLDVLGEMISDLRERRPGAAVTVIRRFEGPASIRGDVVRTPDEAIWTPATAGEGEAALVALGVDEVVAGPVGSVDEVRAIEEALAG